MKTTVTEYDFTEAFRRVRPDNFTYDGLKELFAWFEELEQDIGEDIEFDVIAICCEFTQYEDLEEFQGCYGDNYEALEDIEEQTSVVRIPGSDSFIIQDF